MAVRGEHIYLSNQDCTLSLESGSKKIHADGNKADI